MSKQGDSGICRALIQMESGNMGRGKKAGYEGSWGSHGQILSKGVTWADLGFERNDLASEMKVNLKRAELEEFWSRV